MFCLKAAKILTYIPALRPLQFFPDISSRPTVSMKYPLCRQCKYVPAYRCLYALGVIPWCALQYLQK